MIGWETGLKPDILQAIGNVALATAEVGQLLRQIYCKHAGLD
jgi:hypothetical protein